MNVKRGKVWLAAAGLVINAEGKWLVVKKKYGGLKGMWSLPAGFVDEGETVDEAALREVKEETGLHTVVLGVIGIRTGVIDHTISDNMLIFHLRDLKTHSLKVEASELLDVQWKSPHELKSDQNTSIMVHEMLKQEKSFKHHQPIQGLNPGDQFKYSSYKLFI
ncbi:NUDIX domain-containing protein [Rossellomorea aquimaris]|uniref:NUDIX domain-containing protein n=1 Tax=Rossellomorea aquimaris TaxID=189382 RepID=UPI0012E81477|nr:NUDIX hydrolase [Rossellomorea aquimaris]